MKKPFSWDYNSDQPYQLKDRVFKKAMRKKELSSLLWTIFSTLFILPIAILLQFFVPKRTLTTEHFFGMSINLDKEPKATKDFIDELDVNTLLIRFPLWEMDKIGQYLAFVQQYQDKKIILNVLQDREHVETLPLLKEHLDTVFQQFSPYVDAFQVGSTINRAKWGFFSVHEYLRFYEVAYRLKTERYNTLTLLGPSVIDFEYHFTIHALFNFFTLKYDALTALLYVDRRGAPENSQMGYNLLKKIDLLDTLSLLSPKSRRKIYITETNWPISNTAPFAPTSEHECVDEEHYANFMVRYYLLAFASQKIDAVYWHQLIAPGYGLVDNRKTLHKRTAFTAFKTMCHFLKNSSFISLEYTNKIYTLITKNKQQSTTVKWSLDLQTLTYNTPQHYYDRDGHEYLTQNIELGPSPIYIIKEN